MKIVALSDFLTGDQIEQAIRLYGQHGIGVVDAIQAEVIEPNLAAFNEKLGFVFAPRFLAYVVMDKLVAANAETAPVECPHCQQIAEADGDILPPACPAHGGRPAARHLELPATRHIAYVAPDIESRRRGGSCRTAACLCGWKGPDRVSLELAAEDALEHEGSEFWLVRKEPS